MQRLDSTHSSTNAKMDRLIYSYSIQIDSLVNQVVGYTAKAMVVKKPESDLGNLLADFMVRFAMENMDTKVDFALFNTGGFRIPLPGGAITVGHIMQLMPFDNTLVIMDLTGNQVNELAVQIIKAGGDPISGEKSIQIIEREETVEVLLGGVKVKPKSNYRVLTSSYLAEGGDNYTVFKSGINQVDSGILIRDAIAECFRQKSSKEKPIDAKVEQRIILKIAK